MPRVRFLEKFNWHVPGVPVTIAYKAGQLKLVTTPCARLAIQQGKAVLVIKDNQDEAGSQGG